MHRHAASHALEAADRRRHAGGPIRLHQEHDRSRPALPGQGQVALEPSRVHGLAQRRGEEQQVDVRQQNLRRGHAAGRLAHDLGAARQDGTDDRASFPREQADRDPVSHRREARAAARLVTQSPDDLGETFPCGVVHAPGTTAVPRDARGNDVPQIERP